jgi:hypothetical protein
LVYRWVAKNVANQSDRKGEGNDARPIETMKWKSLETNPEDGDSMFL